MSDYLIRATGFDGHVRAFAARTTEIVEEMRRRHDMWNTATAAAGRTLTATLMMGAMLKGNESLSVKIKGGGPIGQIVAEANAHGEGVAYVTNPHVHFELNDKGKLDVTRAVGTDGFLYVTKDLGLKEPYQGSSPIVSGEIGEDHRPETHLIPIILETALGKREHITIFGDDYPTKDGTCIRDYVHVEDLIDAHILALKYLQKGGKSDVFNLGSSRGFSVKEMIDMARAVTGREIPAKIGKRRPGDPSVLIASSEKAKKVLGWNPTRTNIERIIQDAWRWHSTHPDGYRE